MPADWIVVAIAALVVGWWSGVRWAERKRAFYDIVRYARQTWRNRSEYRRKGRK